MLSLKKSFQLARNMGLRYISFRLVHELKVRLGLFKRKFPVDPPFQTFISLLEWKQGKQKFFFDKRPNFSFTPEEISVIQKEFNQLQEGKHTFFSSLLFDLGKDYDWVTNPETGFRYNHKAHWTEINDYNKEAGDIKYVWEKSRFSFLYTIMRHDAATGLDHSEKVWEEVLSWITANPINCGPNYKCSQEMSLRVLNWTYAINFYKDSPSLSEEIFQKIIFQIYWQLQHVFQNINFSRIAVRNNHAITETLALYLGGLLFPFFPEAEIWKAKGKAWFEEEIAYQIYEDGTFLQFSMNYHRVVVQLLTWAIRLSERNGEKFSPVVYDRAFKSLDFLTTCMDPYTGWLPNYGSNDGALFFKFNHCHYRDYRPQLEALSVALGANLPYGGYKESLWYGMELKEPKQNLLLGKEGAREFTEGGYYTFRHRDAFTFIRCGNHKDRPLQADNLHLDIWYKGSNLLHDGGSYKYNTSEENIKYFMGTGSHNTVMLEDCDQMEKGMRFVWFDWTQCEDANSYETGTHFCFEGTIRAFQYIGASIRHQRKVKVSKQSYVWEIEDVILNKPADMRMKQLWHTSFPEMLHWEAYDNDSRALPDQLQEGAVSHFYGKKETCTEIIFSTTNNKILTKLTIK